MAEEQEELKGVFFDGAQFGEITEEEYKYLVEQPMPRGAYFVQIPAEWSMRVVISREPDITPEKQRARKGLDSEFRDLTEDEKEAFKAAVSLVYEEAVKNAHKRPMMTTLIEEQAELILSLRGKHDDPPELELKQVASVAINLLWQMLVGQNINNIITKKD